LGPLNRQAGGSHDQGGGFAVAGADERRNAHPEHGREGSEGPRPGNHRFFSGPGSVKIGDIDRYLMLIHVEQGKGQKGREVM
jgi:hypothetical protein